MIYKIRTIIEIFCLALFFFLIYTNRAQLWLGLVAITLIATYFWGRFYCGWLCPIMTTTRGGDRVFRALGLKSRNIPGFIQNNLVRNTFFILFFLAVIFTAIQGQKVPFFLLLLPPALFLIAFFKPAIFHRYLCPFGKLFALMGKRSRRGLVIDESCIHCGLCLKVCPADALAEGPEQVHLQTDECLLCHACQEVCPKDAIHYKKF